MMLEKEFQKKRISLSLMIAVFLILAFCASFAPWFNIGYDMSSVWGLTAMIEGYLIIPFIFAVAFMMLYQAEKKLRYGILTEVSFFVLFGLYFRSLVKFEMFYQPALGPDFQTGLDYGISSSKVFFWISAAFTAVAFIIFQFSFFSRKK